MQTGHDRSYWERACDFFRGSGSAEAPGSYFLHNKNAGTVRIGIGCRRSVSVDADGVRATEGGRVIAAAPADGPVFKRVEELVRPEAPSFFIVSPDLRRRFVDHTLPQVLLVQPVVEFAFSRQHPGGDVSYAQDPGHEAAGRELLRHAPQRGSHSRPIGADGPAAFADLAAGWSPAEDDDDFRRRLASAIAVLQDHPDGKMTLTRAYQRDRPPGASPFALYELQARVNGEYACSHFFCLGPDVFSLGTTPENILEFSGRTLSVDVVAATCRAGADEDTLARELHANPKQLKEHTSSLANRQNRFRAFCTDGSIRVTRPMEVKRLRNVCHLYSAFTGTLRPAVTMFDLLGNVLPLLGARPRELLAAADAEAAPHRYYGGVFGHLHGDAGGCFLNIRNALLDHDVMHAKVGVGVLKESDVEGELLETRDKLSGLLEAVHVWERGTRAGTGPL